MSNLYRRPSIDASYQVSVHLAKQFQSGFLKISQGLFLAHLSKGNANFCHHLASVVR
jgi:hypothetical protein